MRADRDHWRSFLLVAVICIAMEAVGSFSSWNIRPESGFGTGEAGTSDDDTMALATYDLDAGDTIYYEYEASEACWFIIRTFDGTDPFNTIVDERLNLSGTQNAGSFECPVDGQYCLLVTFLGTPPEGIATIDYYTQVLNEHSILVVTATTTLLIAMTILLVYLAHRDHRSGYRGGCSVQGTGCCRRSHFDRIVGHLLPEPDD